MDMTPIKNIKEEDVRALLDNPLLVSAETRISSATRRSIVETDSNISVQLKVKELNLAKQTKQELIDSLGQHSDLLVIFGIALIRGESQVPEEEEFDPEEGNQQTDGNRVLVGLGRGFSLTYLCYLSYLLRERTDELFDFLQQRRIPQAKKFLSRLKRYFRHSCTTNNHEPT